MINISDISISYGARFILKNSSFLIRPGDRIGLVGPNGAGKTTVFRIISGEEKPDDGTIAIEPGTVIGYFSQETGDMKGRSALLETISGAGKIFSLGAELSEIEHSLAGADGQETDSADMEKLVNRYGELQSEYEHLGGYEIESRARSILSGLGISEERQDMPVEHFSGGWKMRIALAKILLLNPDVLLIDEPTNHLDIESIIWLENWLRAFRGAIVMTSHDRDFMTRICSRTAEVAAGTITSYSGDYDFYLRERDIRRQQLIASHRRQQAMLAKEEEFIARFAARASHAAQVQSRIKTIEKIERIEIPQEAKVMKFSFPAAKRSGDIVASMENLSKSWELAGGKRVPVFSGISGVVKRGDKIAVTGINGAGKSTLLKIITGQTEPSGGSFTTGASVDTGYFSQYSCDSLNPEKSIFDEVSSRIPHETIGYIKNLLGAFLFPGDDVDKKIGILSGGEKTRVMLACLLAQPLNFLVLDEPTNHLDIASREVLLQALRDFDGTVMIVSHDRYFLRSFVNRVFEIENSSLRTYEGDYTYYLDKKACQV